MAHASFSQSLARAHKSAFDYLFGHRPIIKSDKDLIPKSTPAPQDLFAVQPSHPMKHSGCGTCSIYLHTATSNGFSYGRGLGDNHHGG